MRPSTAPFRSFEAEEARDLVDGIALYLRVIREKWSTKMC